MCPPLRQARRRHAADETGSRTLATADDAVLCAVQTEVGQYIADPAATSTVLTLPASSQNAADYTIKVRSEVTGENLSTPFPLSTVSFCWTQLQTKALSAVLARSHSGITTCCCYCLPEKGYALRTQTQAANICQSLPDHLYLAASV